jgi:hypothetical protein
MDINNTILKAEVEELEVEELEVEELENFDELKESPLFDLINNELERYENLDLRSRLEMTNKQLAEYLEKGSSLQTIFKLYCSIMKFEGNEEEWEHFKANFHGEFGIGSQMLYENTYPYLFADHGKNANTDKYVWYDLINHELERCKMTGEERSKMIADGDYIPFILKGGRNLHFLFKVYCKIINHDENDNEKKMWFYRNFHVCIGRLMLVKVSHTALW